jgi:hypothetical protein
LPGQQPDGTAGNGQGGHPCDNSNNTPGTHRVLLGWRMARRGGQR